MTVHDCNHFGWHLKKQPKCFSLSEYVFSQDKEKMKIKKLSSPPEPEEIQSMVNYARNVIEEFRKAKHFRHILSTLFEYFFPSNFSDQKSSYRSFSTRLNSLPVVASIFLVPPFVTVPWLSGTPQRTTGDVRAQHGKDGSDICRHQRVHVAHDVPGYGCLSLHAGLEWSHELWREDRAAIQVNGSAVMAVT